MLVNHGGTEMGQGLHTKVAQVVADELGLDFARVRVTATDTHKVANTSATAASTGSDLNGKAAEDAARQFRERLVAMLAAKLDGVDAADAALRARPRASVGGSIAPSRKWSRRRIVERVQLWSDGFYATPGLLLGPRDDEGPAVPLLRVRRGGQRSRRSTR